MMISLFLIFPLDTLHTSRKKMMIVLVCHSVHRVPADHYTSVTLAFNTTWELALQFI